MKKADEAMQLKNYAISADMYDQLASNTKLTKDVRQTAAYRGAESYRYNHQPKKALKLYVKAKKYGAKDPVVTYRVAQMYKQLNQYENAIENFKYYQKEMPSDERVESMIKGCESALKWKEEKTRYTITPFKPANDRASDDFFLFLLAKHQSVISMFCRRDF